MLYILYIVLYVLYISKDTRQQQVGQMKKLLDLAGPWGSGFESPAHSLEFTVDLYCCPFFLVQLDNSAQRGCNSDVSTYILCKCVILQV